MEANSSITCIISMSKSLCLHRVLIGGCCHPADTSMKVDMDGLLLVTGKNEESIGFRLK